MRVSDHPAPDLRIPATPRRYTTADAPTTATAGTSSVQDVSADPGSSGPGPVYVVLLPS